MVNHSNRLMRQQILDERKAKNKILIQYEKCHKQLKKTLRLLEQEREENKLLLKWQSIVKGTWIYGMCKYIRLV